MATNDKRKPKAKRPTTKSKQLRRNKLRQLCLAPLDKLLTFEREHHVAFKKDTVKELALARQRGGRTNKELVVAVAVKRVGVPKATYVVKKNGRTMHSGRNLSRAAAVYNGLFGLTP